MHDTPLFNKKIGSSLLKDSIREREPPVAIASTDEITLVATQTAIYSTTTNSNELIKIFNSIKRIKDLFVIHHINLIIIIYDDYLEIRHLSISSSSSSNEYTLDKLVQSIGIRATGVFTWNNLSSRHTTSNDNNSDMMSLATAVIDHNIRPSTPPPPTALPMLNEQVIDKTEKLHHESENEIDYDAEITDLITCVGITFKHQVVILKWHDSTFIDRYNLYLSNINFIEFINENKLVCNSPANNPNNLIVVNLSNSKITHYNLQKILNIKNSMISFNNNTILSNISYFNNNLIFLKYDSFISLHYPNFKKLNNIKLTNTNFKSSKLIFPFVFLAYDNFIEIRSIINFKLFQTIQLNSILKIDYHDRKLAVLSRDKLTILELIGYNQILELLYQEKDYDNAILLVENLDITNFVDDELTINNSSIPNNKNLYQLKFEKLRKFQLLKATDMLNDRSKEDFIKAIDIFTEFLASPSLVISALSDTLKSTIKNIKEPSELESFQIYQLIKFFTDSRRKLIRLLENQYTIFKYNNLEISLSIYKIDDPSFSVSDNLEILDNYLFKCYLLVNKRMLNPFFRSNTFCNSEMVERQCKERNLLDQLITFYYTRKKYKESIELLVEMGKFDELVNFLIKLTQLDPVPMDLIINNLDLVIKHNLFNRLLMNDNLDYSNLNFKQVIKYLREHNQENLLLSYLEYVFFIQQKTGLEVTNELFDKYLRDVDTNYEKIEKLFKMGTYNSNQIMKKLKNLPSTKQRKTLMIQPMIKLGRYDDVINIYIHDLKDIQGCVDFCLHIRNIKNDSLSKGLIFKVIDICLNNKDYDSIINYVLNNSDLDFINFEEILIKLPKDISINLMSSFLVLNMKKMNTLNHNLVIKNELLKVNVVNMKLNKMSLERKMTKLTSNSSCVQCGGNFNKTEILRFQPNGDILHYKCSNTM